MSQTTQSTTGKRCCANCSSYMENLEIDGIHIDRMCLNLLWEGVEPGGVCDEHETESEYQSDVQAIELFRTRIGLPAKPERGIDG